MKPNIIFVYNADSGLFNTLADAAHKIFSPQTYSCNLCALTHSNFGMREEWKRFVETLKLPVEFLHADELRAKYGMENLPLPVILKRENEKVETLADADSINECQNIGELKQLIVGNLSSKNSRSFDDV